MTLPMLSRSEAEAVCGTDGFHVLEKLSSYRFGEPDPQATEYVHERYAFTRNQSIAYSADVSAERQRAEMDLGEFEHLCLRGNTTADYVVRVLSRIVAAAVEEEVSPFDARSAVESKYSRLNEGLRRAGEDVHDLSEIFGSRRWLRDASADLAALYEAVDRIFGGYIDRPDPASDGPSPARMDEMRTRTASELRTAVLKRRIPRSVWSRIPKAAIPHVLDRSRLEAFCAAADIQPLDAGREWCLWVPRDSVEEGIVSVRFRRTRRGKLVLVAVTAVPAKKAAQADPPRSAGKPRPKRRSGRPHGAKARRSRQSGRRR